MPRRTRVIIPGAPHHIVLRGNNRRRLFSYAGDYRRFLRYVENALEQTECLLHALTLMANHVHLNATPPSREALARMIKHSCQRYSQFRNASRDATGKLFEQRYECFPIQDEKAMAVTTVYIDLNPWKAGLVKDPVDYPWSTCAHHAGAPQRSSIPSRIWTPSAWYMGLGSTDEQRAIRYREMANRFYMGGDRPRVPSRIEKIDESNRGRYSRRVQRPGGGRAT